MQLPHDCSSCVQEGSSSVNRALEAVHKAIHSTEFWSNGRNVVEVLQLQVVELTDGYGSTLGYLYEAMKRAEEAFKQHLDGKEKIRKVSNA